MILRDLEPGGMLDGLSNVDAVEAFKIYRQKPEFQGVVFDQFKARLADHLKQAVKGRNMAKRDDLACQHDRKVLPRKNKTAGGGKQFDNHPAKAMLRADMDQGLHIELGPSGLHQSRTIYKEFPYKTFKHHIYQEKRRRKFLRHLELEREKKVEVKKKETKEEKKKRKKKEKEEAQKGGVAEGIGMPPTVKAAATKRSKKEASSTNATTKRRK